MAAVVEDRDLAMRECAAVRADPSRSCVPERVTPPAPGESGPADRVDWIAPDRDVAVLRQAAQAGRADAQYRLAVL